MTDLIFFDCDGVLVDSEPLAAQTTAELMTNLGVPMDWHEANALFTGKSFDDMVSFTHQKFGVTLPNSYYDDYETLLFQRFTAELSVIPGIKQTLQALDRPYCVTSNSDHRRLQQTLRGTGLLRYFGKNIFSAQDVKAGKPAPDLFMLAAHSFDVPTDRCTVIDDSVSGIQAAVKVGARAIGFTGGGHIPPNHAQHLLNAGAAITVSSAKDLTAELLRPSQP